MFCSVSQTSTMEKWRAGHRARLAVSPAQAARLDEQAHAARTLWNLLHDWWSMIPREKRSLEAADAAIRQARTDIDWLAVLPAQAAQAVLKTYFQAWRNCWEGRAGAPRFKARSRSVMAVDVPQGRDLNIVRVHRRWGMVNIPKLGRVRFRWTRDLPVGKRADQGHRVTAARLIKDALGWHIVFRIETLEPTPDRRDGPEVGLDAGVCVALALSDGDTKTHGAWLTDKEQAKLVALQQKAAHQQSFRSRGERMSNRLRGTYDQIRRLRARAKRRHLDWQHKTTTELADTFGVVVVEALPIANMVRRAKPAPDTEHPGRFLPNGAAAKTGLNRVISQEAWARTIEQLAYKTARRGGTLYRVPAPGTSQRCSACGTTTPGSRESQAVFACKNPDCRWSGNADTNAARNILHLYRTGHALVPAAGRSSRQARKRVKPATAR
jgi:putative transposase